MIIKFNDDFLWDGDVNTSNADLFYAFVVLGGKTAYEMLHSGFLQSKEWKSAKSKLPVVEARGERPRRETASGRQH